MSASAPLITACEAPALAIAMYRCLFAALLTFIWMTVLSRRVEARFRAAVWPGLALGAHFAAWLPSLRLTSVALSTAMISTQPVWSAVLSRLSGAAVAPAVWWGIGISVGGVALLTGFGDGIDGQDLLGMGLALVAAVLAAAYVVFAERLRPTTDLGSYTVVVYSVAAVGLLAACLASGAALTGYSARDWWLIIAITLVAQIGGHSVVNAIVHRVSATVISTAILLEAPGATILAALFLGQSVGISVLLGLAVMLLGLVVVIRGGRQPIVESGV